MPETDPDMQTGAGIYGRQQEQNPPTNPRPDYPSLHGATPLEVAQLAMSMVAAGTQVPAAVTWAIKTLEEAARQLHARRTGQEGK